MIATARTVRQLCEVFVQALSKFAVTIYTAAPHSPKAAVLVCGLIAAVFSVHHALSARVQGEFADDLVKQ